MNGNRVGIENFKLYIKEVNTFDDDNKKCRFVINNKKIERTLIFLLGVSFGLITIKVVIEQMIMQWGVYLK